MSESNMDSLRARIRDGETNSEYVLTGSDLQSLFDKEQQQAARIAELEQEIKTLTSSMETLGLEWVPISTDSDEPKLLINLRADCAETQLTQQAESHAAEVERLNAENRELSKDREAKIHAIWSGRDELQAAAKQMTAALEDIIRMNRQTAEDKYGDPEKAESWACVTTSRQALATFSALQ